MIRTAVVLLGGAVLTGFFAGRVLVYDWFRRAEVQCRCDEWARRWASLILRLAGTEVEVHGLDRVAWGEPAVVVANHQSWFDVFVLAAYLPGRGRFVAKQELSRIPIFGRAWRKCGHISIDRKDRRRSIESLDRAARRVRDQSLMMILFPEGTRSPDGRLQEFKKGAFVLAIKTGVPIVPVGISGSRDVMPKGSWTVKKGRIRLEVGEPILVRDLSHGDRERLREVSRNAVASLIRASALENQNEGGHE